MVSSTLSSPSPKKPLTIFLASPRGFCAGVDRAIQIVEKAIEKYGAPVYVRHEIVHNRFVVQELEKKGAIFVDELEEVEPNRPVIFSAHGVSKAVVEEAQNAPLFYIDATCPLVTKVHKEVERYASFDHEILFIGHKGHPEVLGTMGQVPQGTIHLIETVADVEKVEVRNPEALAYATQTTLSVDEVADIVEALVKRFPAIKGPRKEDICYATTNRQVAVKTIAPQVGAFIIVGAPNSSNSLRLVETAQRHGCPEARLYQRAQEVDWEWVAAQETQPLTLGITAGASAPEILVQELIQEASNHFEVTLADSTGFEETIHFNLPKVLRDDVEIGIS